MFNCLNILQALNWKRSVLPCQKAPTFPGGKERSILPALIHSWCWWCGPPLRSLWFRLLDFFFLIFTVCGEKEGKIYLCVLLFCPESLSLDWNHNEFCEQHKQKAAGKYLFSATSFSCFLFLFQISSLLLNIDCKQDLSVGNP